MKRIFALALCVLMCCAAAACAETATVTVNGSATVFVDADTAMITLGVREYKSDVLTAQNTVNEKISAICTAVEQLGIPAEDITTASIYIYANYNYNPDNSEYISGYTAYNSICISTNDMEIVGRVIDAAFAAGANTLDDITFTAEDSTGAKDQALALAVADAMRKARVIAEASGMNLGNLVSIEETGSVYHGGYDGINARYEEAAMAGAAAATTVQAAQVNVSCGVCMVFELQP